MPSDTRGKYNVIQWLMFQMASVGPMLGQAHHFRRYAPEKLEYAINRYTNEAKRIYGVIDKRLGEAKYLAGDYSIADIATYPWLVPHSMQGQALEDFPNLKKWYDELRARPATQRGFAVMSDVVEKMRAAAQANQPAHDPKTWEILFGNKQFEKR
jgi:GST-like protein